MDAENIERIPVLSPGLETQHLIGAAHVEDRVLILIDLRSLLAEAEQTALSQLDDPTNP